MDGARLSPPSRASRFGKGRESRRCRMLLRGPNLQKARRRDKGAWMIARVGPSRQRPLRESTSDLPSSRRARLFAQANEGPEVRGRVRGPSFAAEVGRRRRSPRRASSVRRPVRGKEIARRESGWRTTSRARNRRWQNRRPNDSPRRVPLRWKAHGLEEARNVHAPV